LGETEWSGLKMSLPSNLHLLTLMKVFNDEYEVLNSLLVRIEHFYEKDEDSELSKPVKVNLFDLFGKHFNVTNVQELAIGANMRVEELDERLKWNSDAFYLSKQSKKNAKKSMKEGGSDFTYVLYPMEIRTFRIWYLPFQN
jgi:lysosomal alpha-mannosidase